MNSLYNRNSHGGTLLVPFNNEVFSMDVDLYSRLQVCVIVDIVYTQGNSTAIHKKWLLEVFYHQTYHLVTYSKNIQT